MGGTCSCDQGHDHGSEAFRMNDLDNGKDKQGDVFIPPEGDLIRKIKNPPKIFEEKFKALESKLGPFDTRLPHPDGYKVEESDWLEITHRDPNAKKDPYNLHLKNLPSVFDLEMKHITTGINPMIDIPINEVVYQFYKGGWRKKRMHGTGKLVTIEGHIYEGHFKSGKPHGTGRLAYSTGEIIQGDFKKGYLYGFGKMIGNDGSIVEGNFRNR